MKLLRWDCNTLPVEKCKKSNYHTELQDQMLEITSAKCTTLMKTTKTYLNWIVNAKMEYTEKKVQLEQYNSSRKTR